MVEPEVAYCDLNGLLELAENYLSHIVQSVLKNRASELQVVGRDTAKLQAVTRLSRGSRTTTRWRS